MEVKHLHLLTAMYNDILSAIKEVEQVSNLETYLQSLQPFVRQLRQSYRSRTVAVDYRDFRTQAAYLLAYYPQYVELTSRCINVLSNYIGSRLVQQPGVPLQACFFGGGPAPEALAFAKFLQRQQRTNCSFTAHIYDIAATTWAKSREVTHQVISRHAPNICPTLVGNQIDLCQRNALVSTRSFIQSSQLFIVQNCLNEFTSTPQVFVENIEFLMELMPADSALIVADLSNYGSVNHLMEQVETRITGLPLSTVVRSWTEGSCRFRSKIWLPSIVAQHLLTGEDGLMPRQDITYNYMIVQKQPAVVRMAHASSIF